MKLMRVLLKWNLPWKKQKERRKNDKHKVAKWDKIEIRLGVKGNSVCEPLKRRESNLPKRLVLVSSSGHYSKVSASCLPSIRKQQQQQSWKKPERGAGDGRVKGKLETKVERVFRRVYNLPEAYDAARNFNYGQLNGQNFGTVSSQIYPWQLPVASYQLPAVPPLPPFPCHQIELE